MRIRGLARRQQGMTLVELMIGLTLTLVLMVALVGLYVGSRQTYRVDDDNSRLQEAGRFAIELLGRNVRQAGFSDVPTQTSSRKVSFTGVPLTGQDGPAGASDTVTVSFDAPADCVGAATPAGIAVNRFSVNAQATALECTGNGGTSQALLDGVEDLQVRYGIDTDGDQSADRYVADPAAAGGGHDRVISVQVCLRIRSPAEGVTDRPQTYTDCGGAVVTAPDRRLRRIFTATFNLRNRVSESP
ncbi:MAG: PilW family protein [Betaproteobacteria bacterium]|nr:PilW family protein [Betaproteobacteria bacterium]